MLIKINNTETIELNNVTGIVLQKDIRLADQDVFENHNNETNTVILDTGYVYEFHTIDQQCWQSFVFKTKKKANKWMELILAESYTQVLKNYNKQ